jgi:hypothetical protein
VSSPSGVTTHGAGNWAAVAKACFPNGSRTDGMCRKRWGVLKKEERKAHDEVRLQALLCVAIKFPPSIDFFKLQS